MISSNIKHVITYPPIKKIIATINHKNDLSGRNDHVLSGIDLKPLSLNCYDNMIEVYWLT